MKQAKLLLLAGLGALLHFGALQAQEDINPVPQPPYLAPVPDYGHWVITFKFASEAAAKAAAPTAPGTPADAAAAPVLPLTRADIIKTGDMRLVTLSTGNGPPRIYYQRGDWIVTINPQNEQQAQVLVPTPFHLPYPFYTEGFMLMDGMVLNASNFKGVEKYNGKSVYHYQPEGGEVWIAPGTMLPVAVKSTSEGLIAEYQFLPPPPAPFTIPHGQNSVLDKAQKSYKAVQAMR
jgi:hypothetical protein